MKKIFQLALLGLLALGVTSCVEGLEDDATYAYPAEAPASGSWTYTDPTGSDPFEYTVTLSQTEAGDTTLAISAMYPYGMTNQTGGRVDSAGVMTIGKVTSYDPVSGTIVAEGYTDLFAAVGEDANLPCTIYASYDRTQSQLIASITIPYANSYYDMYYLTGMIGLVKGTATAYPKNLCGYWRNNDGSFAIQLDGYNSRNGQVSGSLFVGVNTEDCSYHYDGATGTLTVTSLTTGNSFTGQVNAATQLVVEYEGTTYTLTPAF